ncbi:Cache 3/Cache 2 fusion domain-containing protein [Blastococcus capsensis]|uniref:Cache 3/Cache 2 fusion domain-containing protein n=1 Tax=Blastococcus capsensis TaxID=1564163 RepID=UPI0025425AC9|nr:Cache 3/Cache 2 fusion domain-containing protein [Blastococcus capsensis]MDK3254997.1 Cache 3/Cache 2 fusion domain-containing protein [Blastococcus capsensis]
MRRSTPREFVPPTPSPAPPAVPAPPAARPTRRRATERDTSMEAAAQQAGVLAQASREVSDTSSEAAASLAELRSAIGDIAASTGRASTIAEEAVREARAVDERIAALQAASESITEFVRLVSAISQQSRFLALNASVEAARAGDVGRGFAVVADEVKELAGRTAQAAQDIDAQITAVQQETQLAVEAVRRITGTLGSIAEAQDTIAAAVEQQRAATDRVVENVDRAADGSARITEAVGQLADSQRVVYVRRALAVAEQVLADLGGARLGERRATHTVRDQATGATHSAQLADLLVGETALDRSDDPRRPSVLVDEVVRQIGGSCTLFQRLDDAGSMVRAATTVINPAGRRNVGTYIARTGPDGTPNPVLAAVLAGETYTGAATVADRPYFTAYTGLYDGSELIGVLYVGLPLDSMPGAAG